MRTTKPLILSALCLAFAAPALADGSMNDAKANLYDADFEIAIADHGYAVGVAAYGANDADYDVYLSDAALFQPVLGHYDADYESKLNHGYFAKMEIASR